MNTNRTPQTSKISETKKPDPPKGYRRSHFIHIQALSKRVPNGIGTAQYV
jgi:hypothetical protein